LNRADLLNRSRNYEHAAAVVSIASSSTLISASNSARYNAAPTDASTFNGSADFVHIVNLSSNNSYWTVGNNKVVAATATAGGEPCLANGGDLWLQLEDTGVSQIRGICDSGAGNHCINWYKSKPARGTD